MYIFVFFISGSYKEHSVCCVLLISPFKNESVKRQLSNKNVPMVVGNTKVARKSQRSQCLKRHFRLVVGLVIVTPPKFNSEFSPETGWLEDYVPFWGGIFPGASCKTSGGYCFFSILGSLKEKQKQDSKKTAVTEKNTLLTTNMGCVYAEVYGMLKRWTVLSKFETCTVIDEKKLTLFVKVDLRMPGHENPQWFFVGMMLCSTWAMLILAESW